MIDPVFFEKQGLLFYRPHFFTPAELNELHAILKTCPEDMAPVYTQTGGKQLNASDRKTAQIDISAAMREAISQKLYTQKTAFENFFKLQLSGCEAPAVLKYLTGYYFRAHRDWKAELNHQPELADMRPRQVSAIIFLSEQVEQTPGEREYQGGELVIYASLQGKSDKLIGLPVKAEPGALIAFRSDLMHEVKPVLAGERITLVTWMF
ncbi:hypothetical protein COW36_19830 [bacterium (Candidatus Blackallbacteria) CG17_big_fil_post_rev_8_21_14_2_50_48_46]|uniref:Fe2OG dioxygenase domain-containing protein n=1 Tax=bacterium (Candidatus Blackallbacteria) CG17_big_fil_post_rev_8_21_14_2_50_48_46 TaxID=2014261 RepID=A0A2M7G0W4_9BACT|nr:MAG: hypothetical protein COW64_15465 [bacterium (Candidatus Blackallbacteria) CG18_big_fil_WC_8_21_14_2_50_49_26]PIW14900.1 MAG: hypothetical protein COW36_19830 [bacterium (Candidatus Blackallbacteria) CG17_big_fil_post_rev_8_21_14_2_50_48_46]PIW44312.1 MAG: hypothetical protein COW20_24530 [bacterium (Candidatus Blackallbacteria) CG13_big_fil_rev_8_21_14_2_50_49_14]